MIVLRFGPRRHSWNYSSRTMEVDVSSGSIPVHVLAICAQCQARKGLRGKTRVTRSLNTHWTTGTVRCGK